MGNFLYQSTPPPPPPAPPAPPIIPANICPTCGNPATKTFESLPVQYECSNKKNINAPVTIKSAVTERTIFD